MRGRPVPESAAYRRSAPCNAGEIHMPESGKVVVRIQKQLSREREKGQGQAVSAGQAEPETERRAGKPSN